MTKKKTYGNKIEFTLRKIKERCTQGKTSGILYFVKKKSSIAICMFIDETAHYLTNVAF